MDQFLNREGRLTIEELAQQSGVTSERLAEAKQQALEWYADPAAAKAKGMVTPSGFGNSELAYLVEKEAEESVKQGHREGAE